MNRGFEKKEKIGSPKPKNDLKRKLKSTGGVKRETSKKKKKKKEEVSGGTVSLSLHTLCVTGKLTPTDKC